MDDEISFSLVSNISALAMMPAIAVARLCLLTLMRRASMGLRMFHEFLTCWWCRQRYKLRLRHRRDGLLFIYWSVCDLFNEVLSNTLHSFVASNN